MGFTRFRNADVFVNLQGDHPFVSEAAIRGVIELVERGAAIATVGAPLRKADLARPHTVKLFVDDDDHAVAFTRDAQAPAGVEGEALHHVGVYAYHPEALAKWATAPQVDREVAEGLEQLRPMAYGATIAVCRVKDYAAPGIDTIDDLRKAEEFLTVFR
jgi:3-deoxy-manno-octulosonate cytidylyltransferase (CMP-KDO synthetase)